MTTTAPSGSPSSWMCSVLPSRSVTSRALIPLPAPAKPAPPLLGELRRAYARSFGRVLGRPRPAGREELLEPARDGLRHELGDGATEGRDLLHATRRDEAHLRAGHHVHRLDVRRKVAVELVHLKLPLEVRDDTKALHDRLRLPPVREVDDELAEDVDLDVVELRQRITEEVDALLDGEHRLLVMWAPDDADHHTVEDAGSTRDHVEVPRS